MPLIKSASKDVVSQNIRTELAVGKPKRQAIAIALDIARRAKKAAGGSVNPLTPPWFVRNEARGMTHTGPLMGFTPGRADKVNTSVANGSHILPSDTVSAIGGGNSLNGHAVLAKMFPASGPFGMKSSLHSSSPSFPKLPSAPAAHKAFAHGGKTDKVEVALSDGEFSVSPQDVNHIGGGDSDRGHRILDAFIRQVRKQTIHKLKHLPGPSQD